jgi:hypothetical protein
MKRILPAILSLCCVAALGQPGSEIYVFDVNVDAGKVKLSNARNISNHKGYDNQPFFPDKSDAVYYASANDSGRTDILHYHFRKSETTTIVYTNEDREYSPTVTPDGRSISCIIQRPNGDQDLGMYSRYNRKKDPVVLINNLKIGYHAWVDKNRLLLFVLGDSNTNTLHLYNIKTKSDTILTDDIGRSLHKIPGQNAMSFVKKSGKENMIKRFDIVTGQITDIIPTLPSKDHLAWLQNNIILMSNGTNIFSYQVGVDTVWQPVIVEGDTSMLKGVTRIAVNPWNSRLALVVSE